MARGQVQTAMLERRIETVFGWPLRLSTSPNQRTLYNFPMQGGAEMLRLAAWRLCEAGIVPNMLVHDGILLEVGNEEQIEQAKEIMRTAGREVCNGFEIGVDVDQRLDTARATKTSGRSRSRCGQRSWARWKPSGPYRGRRGVSEYVIRGGRRIEVEP